jgi:ParB-like chromosome segregation protein Spo0J
VFLSFTFIRIANDHEMLEMALVENIQRSNLNPIEVALSYQKLMEECKLTQEQYLNVVKQVELFQVVLIILENL